MTTPSLRVLVVEDDPPMAGAVGRVLRRAGHHAVVVGTAAEAVACTDAFDLGVFDIDLPDGSGIDAARVLLDDRAVLLALFFSATTDAAVRAEAETLGHFVHKSAGIDHLVGAVDQLVREAIETAMAAGAEGSDTSSSGRGNKQGSGVRSRLKRKP